MKINKKMKIKDSEMSVRDIDPIKIQSKKKEMIILSKNQIINQIINKINNSMVEINKQTIIIKEGIIIILKNLTKEEKRNYTSIMNNKKKKVQIKITTKNKNRQFKMNKLKIPKIKIKIENKLQMIINKNNLIIKIKNNIKANIKIKKEDKIINNLENHITIKDQIREDKDNIIKIKIILKKTKRKKKIQNHISLLGLRDVFIIKGFLFNYNFYNFR